MKKYIDEYNHGGITFNDVKIPLTLFKEGPLGIKSNITYNGDSITDVNPFINAVDIDWNKADLKRMDSLDLEDVEYLETTGLLLRLLKGISEKVGLNPDNIDEYLSVESSGAGVITDIKLEGNKLKVTKEISDLPNLYVELVNPRLLWGNTVTLATVEGVDINAEMPEMPSTIVSETLVGSKTRPIFWNGLQFVQCDSVLEKDVKLNSKLTDEHTTEDGHYTPGNNTELSTNTLGLYRIKIDSKGHIKECSLITAGYLKNLLKNYFVLKSEIPDDIPEEIMYYYIGTVKPTSLSQATTVNEYLSEYTFTNPSIVEKCDVYVLTNADKTVNFYDPSDLSTPATKTEDITTISGYKITNMNVRVGKSSSIIIKIL